MRKSRLAMFVGALALVLPAVPVLAHGPDGGGACRADMEALCAGLPTPPAPGGGNCLKALCPDLTPGPGAFASCLQQHYGNSLSDPCKAQLSNLQAKLDAWKTACVDSGDVANFCPGITDPRQIGKCLRHAVRDNAVGADGNPVSPNCQALLAQHHGHRHHHQESPDPESAR